MHDTASHRNQLQCVLANISSSDANSWGFAAVLTNSASNNQSSEIHFNKSWTPANDQLQ